MRVARDSETDTSHASSNGRVPVVNLSENAPLVGSIALSTPTITPFYGDGLQWLPFGGGSGALQSGLLGLLNIIPVICDGTYRQVLYDTDMSPLTPTHPSFTIDVPNSQIVINTDGNYLLYYSVNPTNSFLSENNGGNSEPEKYAAQLQTSLPANEAFCQNQGSFSLSAGVLQPPTQPAKPEAVLYVTLSNTWSGFLPQGTTIQTILSVTVANPPQNEALFGEGGRTNYMGIVKIA